MLIGILCRFVCGIPAAFITGTVLPGAAVSILLGNLFYGWQARQVALKTGRSDTTALPFGINTPSLVAYVFLIMGPVYRELAAAVVYMIDRKFLRAAAWMFAGSIFSATGLIHAYTLTPTRIANKFGWMAAPDFAAMYVVVGLVLVGLHFRKSRESVSH